MRNWMWAGLAAGILLAGGSVASAGDTVLLGGPSAVVGNAFTDLVRGGGHGGGFHGGGYHGGGFHGYHGGYRGYYGGYHGAYRGYYGGYRGYYGGYYRPYYGFYARAFYNGYYGGGYSYPGAYDYYYTPTYYYPETYYTPTYSYGAAVAATQNYYPVKSELVAPPATTTQGTFKAPPARPYVPPMPPAGNGTFQYDGGPRTPVPMPDANQPRGVLPVDGKLVSLPAQASGGVTVPITYLPTTTATPATRVSYPAYGEEPLPPAPRKTSR